MDIEGYIEDLFKLSLQCTTITISSKFFIIHSYYTLHFIYIITYKEYKLETEYIFNMH